MKRTLLLCFIFTICCAVASAAIFRVGYPGGATIGVDTTLSGAIGKASSGDTIQLYQQYWTTSQSATVNKPLKFVGFGHSLDKNRNLQALTNGDNYPVSLSFDTGSAGSKVSGIYGSTISLAVSNISITRSKISLIQINNFRTLTNLTIGQCQVQNIYEYGTSAISNMYVHNNIISNGASMTYSTGMFVNNAINGSINLLSFIIRNNIFSSTSYGAPATQSNSFAYNLFAGAYGSSISGTGNQFSVNMANTFVNWNSGSIVVDSQLVLKASSPALAAGKNGANAATDCGVFGGEAGEEYIISGLPAIPAIYELSAPTQAATGSTYNINVSVRSQK